VVNKYVNEGYLKEFIRADIHRPSCYFAAPYLRGFRQLTGSVGHLTHENSQLGQPHIATAKLRA